MLYSVGSEKTVKLLEEEGEEGDLPPSSDCAFSCFLTRRLGGQEEHVLVSRALLASATLNHC